MTTINLEVENIIREKQREGSLALIQVIYVKNFDLLEIKNIEKLKKIHLTHGNLVYLDPLLIIRGNEFSNIYVNIEDLEYEHTYDVDLIKIFTPTIKENSKTNVTSMVNVKNINNFNLDLESNISKVKKVHKIVKNIYYLTEWIVQIGRDLSNLYVEVNALEEHQDYNEDDVQCFNIFNKPKKEEYKVTDLINYIIDKDLYANVPNKPKDTKLYIMKNHVK